MIFARCAVKNPTIWVIALVSLFCWADVRPLLADDDAHEKHHDRDHRRDAITATNSAYLATCGACHFAYQAWLLPSGSWKRILDGLDDHYGNSIAVDDTTMREIGGFLVANAADSGQDKRGRKITKSLGGNTPMRITDVPYIQHKHHEVARAAFTRPAVGSAANCPACHPGAKRGDYDDDHVSIPR